MSGRHYSRPHPPLRQRTDDALQPCTEGDNYRTFFRLLDASPGDVPQIRTEALAICNSCQIRDACWDERADETWVKVLDGRKKSGGANATPRLPRAGRPLAELREERKTRLNELHEMGFTFAEAAEDMGIDRSSLRKWLRDNEVTYGDEPKEPMVRRPRGHRALPSACGEIRGYRRHLERGEEPCDECKVANRDHKREQRKRGAA